MIKKKQFVVFDVPHYSDDQYASADAACHAARGLWAVCRNMGDAGGGCAYLWPAPDQARGLERLFAQCRALADDGFWPMGHPAAGGRADIWASWVFFGSRALGEDFDPLPEAGWVLEPAAQGQGLGLEAVQAAHDWFDRVMVRPTVCMISPAHTRSLHIADAVGYRLLREVAFEEKPARLMVRDGPRT